MVFFFFYENKVDDDLQILNESKKEIKISLEIFFYYKNFKKR